MIPSACFPMPRQAAAPRFACAGLLNALAAVAVAQAPAAAEAATPGASAAASVPAPRVRVDRFVVTGNTLLPAHAIDAALAPYRGERTLAELQQAALVVQDLYGRRGWGGVVAFVPPQPVSAGTVEIRVVEGRLTEVSVQGQQAFTEANIRRSLPALAPGSTPNLRHIDAQVQLANENPSKQVQVVLQPGRAAGEARAALNVADQRVVRGWVGLDDTGNTRTGRWRANFGVQHANLFDLDHVASAQFQTSPTRPSRVRVLSGAYRIPFYAQRLAFDAFAAHADIDGGTSATLAGNLSFTGKGRLFGARLSHYLSRVGEIDQRVAAGIEHRTYINSCEIAGLPPGACGPAGESVSVQPLVLDYTARRSGERPLGLAVSLQHNLHFGGARSGAQHFEAVRPGARPRYTLLRVGLSAAAPVATGWQLQGRLNTQFTGDRLVPSEQFGIGGAASVRGYEERELAADRGAAASAELVGPDIARRVRLEAGELRLLVFADAGWVGQRDDTPCRDMRTSCSLRAVGVGARAETGRLKAALYVAAPLADGARSERHHGRAHVALSYSL